jgi:hypothetical protein
MVLSVAATQNVTKYRVIHKSLRDFRPLRYSSRDGHAEWGACQQRERHSKFLSYLTGARYVDPWWRGRCQSCNQVPATRVATAWPSRLLYRRGRKSRRDLWITLYIIKNLYQLYTIMYFKGNTEIKMWLAYLVWNTRISTVYRQNIALTFHLSMYNCAAQQLLRSSSRLQPYKL